MTPSSPSALRHFLLRASAATLIVVVLFAAWSGTRMVRAWLNTERIDYDTAGASVEIQEADDTHRENIAEEIRRAEAAEAAEDTDEPPPGDSTLASDEELASVADLVTADESLPTGVLQTYLIIGTDQRPQYGESSRADVILMFIVPPDDDPILVSLPRDLWIPNPCTGGMSRINANLNGCGDRATGPELLSLAVEQYTGIRIDHFALFDFEGFVDIVDQVGGVEVCVEEAVRTDWRAGEVVFEEGCTLTDGSGALAWMRSRRTQIRNDNGVWVPKPGVTDLERNQRQQDLLIQALERLKGYRNITEFATVVEALSGTFTIDDDLSLWKAIRLAWDQRDLDPNSIQRPVIPTVFYTTEAGASVLLPTEPFQDVLAAVYPNVDDLLAQPGEAP
jgi:LCP family protein required for cell wall assembly